jgi:hypothetical protein
MIGLFKCFSLLLVCLLPIGAFATEKQAFSTDSFYREIIRTVAEVDFKAMAAAYHPDAVLVTQKNIIAY